MAASGIVLTVLLIAGCGDVEAPPRPTSSRVPTTIGEIVGNGPSPWSYRLAGGDVIDVGGSGSSAEPMARLSRELPQPPSVDRSGGLLLVGRDAAGAFYAATSGAGADGCYEIHGAGDLEPGRIHYSSGLVLATAPQVTTLDQRDTHPASWLFEFDIVCLDASGRVTSVHQLALGA
jgi:hypothetical protein